MRKVRILLSFLCLMFFLNPVNAAIYQSSWNEEKQVIASQSTEPYGIMGLLSLAKVVDFSNPQKHEYYILITLRHEDGIDFGKLIQKNDIVNINFKSYSKAKTFTLPLECLSISTENHETCLRFALSNSLSLILSDALATSSGIDIDFHNEKTGFIFTLDDDVFAEWKQVAATVKTVTKINTTILLFP